MSEYDKPVTFLDRRGIERTGYRPFFADEFANNPNSSFRLVGGNNPYHNVQQELLNQFQRTGQIIGGETGDALTYFSRGTTSAGDYLPMNIDKRGDVSRNILYEVNERFKPNNSKLYSVLGGFTDKEGFNQNQILKPNKDASWLQRVNPFERRGIKITTFNTTEHWNDPKIKGQSGMRYSTPLGESVYYDRTKPFYRTSLSQNLKNFNVEADIFLSQPEVANFANKAGTFANYAGIVPLVASEVERKKSDYQNPVTQEYFTKDKVVELDGIKYESATPQQIAMFHPDNADEHPEITDEMRKKFYPKWFK